MAQIKTRGEQLNIQDVSFDISDDTTSITTIASGLTTDTNSRDVLYDEFILNNISSEINANAVTDVFIYDTSKDDDGGAWVDKATNQSWYNETLNTTIRGSTRSFPKLAGIVAESGKITIYDLSAAACLDLTAAACPRWMVFEVATGSHIGGSDTIRTTTALNGVMYVGSDSGLLEINFILDRTLQYSNTVYLKVYPIIDRNINNPPLDLQRPSIIDATVNDIAVASDGNMNNIAYVATAGGVSRIDVDNSVSSWDDNGGSKDDIKYIGIFDGFVYFNAENYYSIIQSVNSPLINSAYNDSNYHHFTGYPLDVYSSSLIPVHSRGFFTFVKNITEDAFATRFSLTKIYPTPTNWGNSMIANISTEFNSGILPGDIRGAWLADTTEETITETEIVVDGGFSAACDVNWICSGFIWTISGGTATMTNTSIYDPLSQIVNTVVGTTYDISFQVNAINNNMKFGVTGLISYIFSTTGIHRLSFVAVAATQEIYFVRSPEFASVTLDNVSIVVVEPDRSHHNKSSRIVGSIDKSPVATGAELVAYSGFSASDYLWQLHNDDLDFGTGDFYVMGWFKQDVLGNYDCLIAKSEASVTNDYFLIDAGLDRKMRLQVGNTLRSSATAFTLGEWHFVVAMVKDNIMSLFVDMYLQASATVAVVTTSGVATLRIGERIDTPSRFNGGLTLWRMGAGVPSYEQIQTIYDQEKLLFFPDTKCTLQGTSDSVETVDYDESTNVITACSLDHITKFNDLVVIDDRAEVVTSISTKYDKELTGV